MKVLVACEFSGTVRKAFREKGHDAWSCDILPAEPGSYYHIQDDVLNRLNEGWDLMIAHPPCTWLCASGLHWNKRGRQGLTPKECEAMTAQALDFVRVLMAAPIKRWAIENPIGCIGTQIRPATQIIQPYDFGEDASKSTCLWLNGLLPLRPTKYFAPRIVQDGQYKGKERWGNQTDSGQNKLPPSDDRWAERSLTYKGIAQAMADQWG